MENQTKNTTIVEQTVDKNQYQTFNPKATLLLNVLPADAGKTAVEPIKNQTSLSRSEEPSEKLLQGLLSKAETSAEKTPFEKRKWQLVSLLAGTLFIITAAISVWLALEMSITATLRDRLEIENQSLREQLTLAGSQITGLKNDLGALRNRNIEPVTENAKLKPQGITPVIAASSPASEDTSRTDAMRKGAYSRGATRAEIIAAMGEPDRIYNSRGYEQLVYFGQKPGRFWLINGRLVQTGG